MTPPSRALVTGATGFLGGALARRLLDLGHQVRSCSRSRSPRLESLGIEQCTVDLGSADAEAALREAAQGCDVVFHVAARTGAWGRWRDYERTNLIGTRQVLSACAEAGVPRLVHTSTPSVAFRGEDLEGVDEAEAPLVLEHHAHYPRSKALAEHWLLQHAAGAGVAAVALRPHLIWGPGDTNLMPRIVARARAGRLARIGAAPGRPRISPTHIEDAVESHVAAWRALVERPQLAGSAYFVTSGETIATWEMIDGMLASQGLGPVRRSLPVPVATALAAALEVVWALLRLEREPPLTRWVVRELATSHWFSIESARRELGYRPRRSVADGLEELTRLRRQQAAGAQPADGR
ncbi:MAG: NAD-dependent epimerase/dehydratase family protein [Acidobacteria bacterium]|nr:MAG: NAD-dependent epimerase/dehydratase family protein [Acidobacteriota bacterium]REK00138.1 MAG: NAD-dependent epimerase/dehydratase family protein [Acidobacteriota bacterium]